MEWSNSPRHFKIQTLLKINCCIAAISAFRVTQHSQIFSLFLRNRNQCIALYQVHNSQALLNLRRGYYSMSSAVDCRGSKLITPYYYRLWVFLYGLRLPAAPDIVCTTCYFSILFKVNTFNVFKVGPNLESLQ